MKLAWNILTKKTMWTDLFKRKDLHGSSAWFASTHYGCSKTWKDIVNVMRKVFLGSRWLIGNGMNTDFWLDAWLLDTPLIEHAISPPTSWPRLSEVLNEDGIWNIHHMVECLPDDIIDRILS